MWVLIVILIAASPINGSLAMTSFTQEFFDQETCLAVMDLIQKSTKEHKEIYADVYSCVPKGTKG